MCGRGPAVCGLLPSALATLTMLALAAQGDAWVLLEPSAWSHSCALGCSTFPLVSAEGKQLGCRGATSSCSLCVCVPPHKGRSLTLFTKPNCCGAHLGKLGCWLWSAPFSSRFQTPACLSQVGWEWGSWSPPIEAESRISPNFDGRTVYFWRAAFAPFPFPGEVRALMVASPAFPWLQTLTLQA